MKRIKMLFKRMFMVITILGLSVMISPVAAPTVSADVLHFEPTCVNSKNIVIDPMREFLRVKSNEFNCPKEIEIEIADNVEQKIENENIIEDVSDEYIEEYVEEPIYEETEPEAHIVPEPEFSPESGEEYEARILSMANDIVYNMPSILKQHFSHIEMSYNNITWSSDAIAYVQGNIIYILDEMIVYDTYYLYHEMAHVWANGLGLHNDPNIIAAYESEWAHTGLYGGSDVYEAIAETVAYIYVGHNRMANAPEMTRLIKQHLGL